jgi:hypothetical protein
MFFGDVPPPHVASAGRGGGGGYYTNMTAPRLVSYLAEPVSGIYHILLVELSSGVTHSNLSGRDRGVSHHQRTVAGGQLRPSGRRCCRRSDGELTKIGLNSARELGGIRVPAERLKLAGQAQPAVQPRERARDVGSDLNHYNINNTRT